MTPLYPLIHFNSSVSQSLFTQDTDFIVHLKNLKEHQTEMSQNTLDKPPLLQIIKHCELRPAQHLLTQTKVRLHWTIVGKFFFFGVKLFVWALHIFQHAATKKWDELEPILGKSWEYTLDTLPAN